MTKRKRKPVEPEPDVRVDVTVETTTEVRLSADAVRKAIRAWLRATGDVALPIADDVPISFECTDEMYESSDLRAAVITITNLNNSSEALLGDAKS